MPINFPSSPAPGQLYEYLGIRWVWNGFAWDRSETGITGIVGSGVVSLNGLTGGITLAAGTGIVLGITQNIITISATGTGGGSVITDYVWSFNGLTGPVTGVTTGVSNIFGPIQTFNGGISGSGATLGFLDISGNVKIGGNLDILGTLNVDGLIISKTGFSGFTLDSDLETVEGVLLDGGEF